MKTTPKYSVGDRVFHARAKSDEERVACVDCDGTGLWSLTTAIAVVAVPCDVCCAPLGEVRGWKTVHCFIPEVVEMTIGRVEVSETSDKCKVTYMCQETGVGSGTCYNGEKAFSDTFDGAVVLAKGICEVKKLLIFENSERDRKKRRNPHYPFGDEEKKMRRQALRAMKILVPQGEFADSDRCGRAYNVLLELREGTSQ